MLLERPPSRGSCEGNLTSYEKDSGPFLIHFLFFPSDDQVIVTSELPRISVMATVLLGEFLHLCHLLLPPELNLTGHCLPSLLQEVASADPLTYVIV